MRFRYLAIPILAAITGSMPTPALAGLLIEVRSTTAAAGGAGAFDVVLINQSGGDVDVGGFSVEVSVATSSGVTFTAVTTATSPAYVFGTLQSPPPFNVTTLPSTNLTALDTDMTSPGYATLTDGATVGLMHVEFSVASWAASGPVAVSVVAGDGTEVTDVTGAPIDGLSATGGTITVTASAVPEPPSVVAMATAATGVGAISLARRRLRRGPDPS
ncbi:PEP-CTERM sorting domain-containing protein [Aquisphaera insulae]|uniref:PEP-CTERM sorting domain-containing protein n=1 Tax=Aquisphaera insulae TaxID=2712864 RepID=UPI0013EC1EB7|nr:PEP-CTERM sorting domain-containing protein [Aquisphaera insulae]